MPRLERNEIIRQLVHIASGAIAFLVGRMGFWGTLVLASAATIFNTSLLPRLAPSLLRPEERAGTAVGIVSYPLVILLLTLLFSRHLEVVAAAWGVMAFGDGAATLAGRRRRVHALAWNAAKSWEGSLAYWFFGTLAAVSLVLWTSPSPRDTGFVWVACAVVVLGSALLESLPLGLDDNLVIPVLTALGLFLLLGTEGGWAALADRWWEVWLPALGVNLAFGLTAYWSRGIDLSGLLAGLTLGVTIYLSLGLPGWVVLAGFYTVGTAATRLGFERKRQAGLAQAPRGSRSARNVLANGSIAGICALMAVVTPDGNLFTVAFVAAVAAAAGDTVASEVGQWAAGRTWLVTTLQRVSPGTEGGISVIGSLAGSACCAAIGLLGAVVGLLGPSRLLTVGVAGVVAIFVDSFLGAALERRGLLDNEAVNFGATSSAALLAFWWAR